MSYAVKEMYYTLQGEGAHTGRPAVFLRFAGCNLWTGREQDREHAICTFCDTDFVGTDGVNGGKFVSAEDLAAAVAGLWPATAGHTRYVVCTGGEPLLQLDSVLVQALQGAGFTVAIETNGTLQAPDNVDWICMSPKAGAPIELRSGNELKLVYPQAELMPEDVQGLDFDHFYLQPMDGPDVEENTRLAIKYCLENPTWRLSLQTHKYLNIP